MIDSDTESKRESVRRTLHSSNLARVEDSYVSAADPPPSGHEPGYQLALPYRGLFAYHVGRRSWLVDPTRTLCISPGWEFFDKHPLADVGHGAILISPAPELVHEVCGSRAFETNPCFVHASVPCSRHLQVLTHRFLRRTAALRDPLRDDEEVVHALRHLGTRSTAPKRASRVIDRAKEILHAFAGERLSLDCVARQVGVAPAYLTQEFTRSEGLPLYQYQLRLRLARALVELPHCQNITELGLDLGFSSHSHFTAAFRKAFGITPSQFRSGVMPESGSPQATPKRAGSTYWVQRAA